MGHLLSPIQVSPPGEAMTVVWGGARVQAKRRLLTGQKQCKPQLCTETRPDMTFSSGQLFLEVLKGSGKFANHFSVFAGFSPCPWHASRFIWLQSSPRAAVFVSSLPLLNPQHVTSAWLPPRLTACPDLLSACLTSHSPSTSNDPQPALTTAGSAEHPKFLFQGQSSSFLPLSHKGIALE